MTESDLLKQIENTISDEIGERYMSQRRMIRYTLQWLFKRSILNGNMTKAFAETEKKEVTHER